MYINNTYHQNIHKHILVMIFYKHELAIATNKAYVNTVHTVSSPMKYSK